MHLLDWIIAVSVLTVIFLVSIRSRSSSSERHDRFTAGRTMPWFLLGGSLAATTLSTDTPLLTTGAFYSDGLRGNWFWLATIPGFMATMFFFAKYWRRSGATTEYEILTLRYGENRLSHTLRFFRAFMDGVVINVLILASVTHAAKLIIEGLLGVSSVPVYSLGPVSLSPSDMLLVGLVATTVAYTSVAGFSAVVRTDMAQVVAAIVSSLVLVGFGLQSGIAKYGSMGGLLDALPERETSFKLIDPEDPYFYVLLCVGWWHFAPGNGLIVQRLVSAKSDFDANATVIWFSILHFIGRAWPWFLIGALAILYAPDLEDPEDAFAQVAVSFLPVGGLGLMAIAFWSAFMSTIDSRLNWGASYVINDCLRLDPNTQSLLSKYAERLAILALASVALLLTLTDIVDSILGVYKYLWILQGGAAFTAMARWYWRRLTIEAEIVSFAASIVIGNLLILVFDVGSSITFALVMATNSVICAVIAVAVSLLFKTVSTSAEIEAFRSKVEIAGPGWPMGSRLGICRQAQPAIGRVAIFWVLSTAAMYAVLSLISALLAGEISGALLSLGVIAVSAAALFLDRKTVSRCLRG